MAAFTTIAVAAGAALTAAGGTANAIKGAKRAKNAQKALDNFKRQELKNVTEGMRVSTFGAELQTQEAQRRFATSVDALRSGGVRGLVGGLGRQEQLQQAEQQRIGADLDRQQVNIDRMAAQDEARIQGMQERRETAAIAGLGSEIAAGRAQQAQGFSSIADAGISMLSLGLEGKLGGEAGGALPEGTVAAKDYVGSAAQKANMAKQAAGKAFGGGTFLDKSLMPFSGDGLAPFTAPKFIPDVEVGEGIFYGDPLKLGGY